MFVDVAWLLIKLFWPLLTNPLLTFLSIFTNSLVASAYQDKEYYVEGVGDSITLTDVDALITPGSYATETTIQFDTVDFDTMSSVGRTANLYTISVSGIYFLYYSVAFKFVDTDMDELRAYLKNNYLNFLFQNIWN